MTAATVDPQEAADRWLQEFRELPASKRRLVVEFITLNEEMPDDTRDRLRLAYGLEALA